MRIGISVGAAVAAACVLAAPAGASAASVAFAEGGNVVVASVDGKQRVALTTDGTPVAPYYGIAQAADGTTIAARMETFDKPRLRQPARRKGRSCGFATDGRRKGGQKGRLTRF
jgi:hypothetical protein